MENKRNLWSAWVLVGVWVGVIALESSDLGSSAHTGSLLLQLWTSLFGRPNMRTFDEFHHILRKTGHFVGYAILSWLIFRALRATWRRRQEIVQRTRHFWWQLRWSAYAILGTAFVASLDEIHQSFNPARTARWQDVVIDSSGAITLQVLLYLGTWFRRRNAEPLPSTY